MIEFERRKNTHTHMNIAPLVDVVFLLLLFFMLTSRLVAEPAIKIALPESKTAETEVQEEIVITVTKQGAIYLGEDKIVLAALQGALKAKLQKRKKPAVKIKADREALLGIIVNVVDEIRLAGVPAFSIETERR